VKILGLANSDVRGGRANIPAGELYPSALQRALARAIGEDIEITAHALWPNPGVHLVVRKWLHEIQPDLVTFSISSFWFLYESTPVKLERSLGTPGRWVSRQSQRLAGTPWLAHNRAFQWGRKQAQRSIGGKAWFEPDEVVARATEVIREILQHEGSYLVVTGPGSGARWAQTPQAQARAAARRETVDAALASFCKHHHVEYVSSAEMEAMRDPRPSSLQGDQLHLDREGHRRVAEHYFGMVQGWVERALAATRDAPSGVESHIKAERT